ncbi:hypothetical protein CDL12_13236 [Handroanthus impetiginosus]|uniref:Uncharacterized protein n=1 Tax=Handroanthus impetiginosus TaxID=429701 RepID=A0A2G9H9C8_9LAMI|nr:hypothetical protein CDL12_13236 [Handroanthus impetiginosus]
MSEPRAVANDNAAASAAAPPGGRQPNAERKAAGQSASLPPRRGNVLRTIVADWTGSVAPDPRSTR